MIRRNISTILQKFNNFSNQKVSLIRCVSGSTTLCDKRAELAKKQKEEQWNRIYIFDDMKYLAIVTRLKLYPALLTILGVPTAYFIQVIDGIPAFSVVPGIFVGICSTSGLMAFSAMLSNTIGIVNVCPHYKNVQMLYIDFIGRQFEKKISIADMRNLEKSKVKFGCYKTFTVKDESGEPCTLKLPVKHCEIYDSTLFKKIFGNY